MGDLANEVAAAALTDRQRLGKLAELLERSGIDIADIGRVRSVRLGTHEMGYAEVVSCEACHGTGGTTDEVCPECQGRQTRRVARTIPLTNESIVLDPAWATGPEWPVVQPAAPTVVKPTKAGTPKREGRLTVALGDPQFGFRRNVDTGELTPMHDDEAIDVMLKLLDYIKPDAVVWVGDGVDLPEWSSKFLVLPEFVLTTQPAIDAYHHRLAQIRATLPWADISIIEGNHDDRLGKSIAKNAMAALRLRQANTPESWPVLSLPNLLRLDELGVNYIGAYPAGQLQIAQGGNGVTPLFAQHGRITDVVKMAKSQRQSYLQGHAHYAGMHAETYEVNGEDETVWAISVGCLCRRDGVVPSTKGGADVRGNTVKRWENWQHAGALITEMPGGYWAPQLLQINHGRAIYDGRLFSGSDVGGGPGA